MADVKAALDYLKLAATRGSRLGLERITELCRRLGEPQNRIPVVHIAGTNGKGSFGAVLTAILTEAGYRVGGFSSPALTGVTDSLRINGEPISGELFAELMADLIPLCEAMDDKPTEFEVLTGLAYELFYREKCGIALVECGMGGDTDSTNVVDQPVLSVITNIAMDHTSFLGGTIAEIAGHKAGIIKKSCPVIYGGNNDEALTVIKSAADRLNAPLTVTDHSLLTLKNSGLRGIGLEHPRYGRLTSKLAGEYQKYNIANALAAVDVLRERGLDIPDNAVIWGISKAQWHGRFEVVSEDPLIIFDGAHNPDGIKAAAESIGRYFSRIVLLVGVMADKEYGLYPEMLGKYIDCAFAVTPDNPRALDSRSLAGAFSRAGIPSAAFRELSEGVRNAAEYAKKKGLPLVALGSLYMYKDFIRAIPK